MKAIIEYKDTQFEIDVPDSIRHLSNMCNMVADEVRIVDMNQLMVEQLQESMIFIEKFYIRQAEKLFKNKNLFIVEFRIPDDDYYSDFCILADSITIDTQFEIGLN